jgi:hypothetical protein
MKGSGVGVGKHRISVTFNTGLLYSDEPHARGFMQVAELSKDVSAIV